MNPAVFWTVVGMVVYAVGEYFSKRYALKPTWMFYWMAVLPYWLVTLCWLPVIKQTNTLAVTSVVWDILYVIISIAIGVLIFQEKLTPTQTLGLVLGAVAIALLTVE